MESRNLSQEGHGTAPEAVVAAEAEEDLEAGEAGPEAGAEAGLEAAEAVAVEIEER